MTEPITFDPVSRQTVSSQIREQLLRRITTGDLAPGARVPSERELSVQFEVARTSVREAIQGLLSLGVIERRGNRTWVAERLPEVSVGRGDTKAFVQQLFETRRVLEVPVFIKAAERSDETSSAALLGLLAEFDQPLTITRFRQLDREFHTMIASYCGNPLLIELYGKVLDQLFRSSEFDALLTENPRTQVVQRIVHDAVAGHRAIADAFVRGDADAMRVAVTAHLETVEHMMIDEL